MDVTDGAENQITPLWRDGEERLSTQSESYASCIPHEVILLDCDALNPILILPIPFLAALGMAATAATTVYAYATLLCNDPKHCEESEQRGFAGSVALSVSIANICSLLALGSLEKLSRRHQKMGLALWIICRSISVAVLALGVYFQRIEIALSGRVFQGLASDNLLHFNLNAIYVRSADGDGVSRLVGASLALFMIGISISPVVAGLFYDFMMSFFLAGGIFAVSLLYLAFVGGTKKAATTTRTAPKFIPKDANEQQAIDSYGFFKNTSLSLVAIIVSPLQPFYSRPASLLPGLALFIYTVVQSYIFSLIIVHTSLVFGFTGEQNGLLLSIVHAVSATYLFLVLFVVPRITRKPQQMEENTHQNPVPGSHDAKMALVSMCMQVAALLGFANATQTWEIYVISALLALGLATPSFIKSYFLAGYSKKDGTRAVGALTMMETLGSLLSPLIFGAWQVLWPGKGVFYGAAGTMGLGTAMFVVATLTVKTSPPLDESE